MKTLSITLGAVVAVCMAYPAGCIDYMDFHTVETSTLGTGGAGGSECAPGTVAPCYGGPEGTEGVGLCKTGEQICNPDGMSYGPCAGEVLPAAENCTNPSDEDCDGLAPTCTGTPLWSKRFGDDGEQWNTSVAVDNAGSVLITGNFQNSVDFGGGPLVSGGSVDLFLVKLDQAGEHLWSKSFGDALPQGDIAIAVDGTDKILIAGSFFGSVDFGGGPLTAPIFGAVFVAKLDTTGAFLWAKSFDGVTFGARAYIAVDGMGNIFVAGDFHDSVNFGGGLITSAGGSDLFVAKFSGTGEHIWAMRFGDAGSQTVAGLTVDDAGNVLVAGSFGGTVDFGGGVLTSADAFDFYAAKLDTAGEHIWSMRIGGASGPDSEGNITVAADGMGSALLVGSFSNPADFGGGPLMSDGGLDLFAAKLDPTKGHVFSRRFGDINDQTGHAVAVDGAGHSVFTGAFSGTVDFGNGEPMASAGGQDIFLAKLDASGSHLWSKHFGDTAYQAGVSVAADKMGNTLLAGQFFGTIDFGNGALVSAGATDIFVAKFTP